LGQCRPAEAEAGSDEALQAAKPDVLQASPPLVDPGRFQTAQERPGGDVVGDSGRTPRLRPLSLGDGGLRPVGALERGLDVDEGRLGQQELDTCPPLQMIGAQAVPQLGQRNAQRAARLCRRVLSPAGHEQLSTGDRAATLENEVGEQGASSAAGQRGFEAVAVDLDDEATAQLDLGLGPLAHDAIPVTVLVGFVPPSLRKDRGKVREGFGQTATSTLSSVATDRVAEEEP
jgi:hypothetical protein